MLLYLVCFFLGRVSSKLTLHQYNEDQIPLLGQAFNAHKACEQAKVTEVEQMDSMKKDQFFYVLPQIKAYLKESSTLRQVNWKLTSRSVDQCKGCVKQPMPKFEGQVNYSTLEGLSLYKKAIDLLALYIP